MSAAHWEDCDCEFDQDPNDPEESWHYRRTCNVCQAVWWSTHCPHDGIQRLCPNGHYNHPTR